MGDAAASVRPWGRNTISRAWRGQEPLWLVFWIYNVLVGILLNFLLAWLRHREMTGAALAFTIFFLVYYLWILVAIWRCAANSMALWCLLARLIVVLNVIWFIGGIVTAFS